MLLVSTQSLLLYIWVLMDFACEYIVIAAAIHIQLVLLCTWVLSDFACEYTIIAAIHMGFKRFCL